MGSLRQAILDANANPGADSIVFAIVGSGVQTIAPLTVLPDITQAVTIDGYTHPGSSANTNAPDQGSNAVLLIDLSGASLPASSSSDGLHITGPDGGNYCPLNNNTRGQMATFVDKTFNLQAP